MSLFLLAWRSLLHRRFVSLLSIAAIALGVALMLGVDQLRHEARNGFLGSVSGIDLVVGARSGPEQLLLYAVFHLGRATNEMSRQSWQEIAANPQVAWTVPIALGDSHRGFPVVGTQQSYFAHYRVRGGQPLRFARGRTFRDLFDVVVGAEVARRCHYRLGDSIVLSHGTGRGPLPRHAGTPFHVSGILAPTETPVDRSLHVSLAAIEAIHVGWQAGIPVRGMTLTPEQARARLAGLQPQAITAMLIGLETRSATFRVQREINAMRHEPLLAILPGVALSELWQVVDMVARVLSVVTLGVFVVTLLGLVATLVAGLEARRRELAILRSLGARPWQIALLLIGEAGALTVSGILCGLLLLYGGLWLVRPLLMSWLGIDLVPGLPTLQEWGLLAVVLGAALLAGLIPAVRAYRLTLADGLSLRS